MQNPSSRHFGRKMLESFVAPLCAGLVLTILAPYNTDVFSLPIRALYWIGLCLAGGLGAIFADTIISRLGICKPIWQKTFIHSVGATFAVAPFVLLIHITSHWQYVLLALFYIWTIAIVIATVAELLKERFSGTPKQVPARPALFDRLPPKFRNAELFAINSEDHYVRIHSGAGEHMLLMRLSDAEDFASPLKGLKPHRSWWVSEAGVEAVTKSGGKLKIRLKSGIDVPVSRDGAKRVREAGWI